MMREEETMTMPNPTRRQLALTAIALSAFIALPAVGQVINEDIKLLADDGEASDLFGWSVAISGTTAIVGLRGNEGGYLYDTTTGQQLFKLTASDAAEHDQFGLSVDIFGSTAIVGAWADDDAGAFSGSAYLFDTITGEQLFKLTAADAAEGDQFGRSVAISGSIAIIGAYNNSDSGSASGSAYLFDISTGQQLFKLTASDAAAHDRFGASVDISGTTAIVGAYLPSNPAGSAYLFDTTTGQQLFKLTALDGEVFDDFGRSVAISGSIAIVGASGNADAGSDSGSAYIFDTSTGQQLFKFIASDAAQGNSFGKSVAISGTTAIVGAHYDDDNARDTGSAYVFNTFIAPCPADLTGEGILDFFDISAFLAAFANNDPIADFTNDSIWDFFDVSAFLQAFAQGCP